MRYEIVTRPYDRTPEGNIPAYEEIEFDSDLAAMAYAASSGWISEDEIKNADEATLKDMIRDEFDMENPSVEELASYLEGYDPSDAFTFYVKNLDTDTYLFFNEDEDVDEWEADWGEGGDDDENYWDEEDEDEEDFEEHSVRKTYLNKIAERSNFSKDLKKMLK